MASQSKWTWMVYMAGDLTSLSAAGERDIREMRNVGSSEDVNIVVQCDVIVEQKTRRFRVEKDGEEEKVQSLGRKDAGDPKTLSAFIEWCAAEYPAERYALVLWGHGVGWTPLELDEVARAAKAPEYSSQETKERGGARLANTFFRTSLEHIFQLPKPRERAICFDDTSGHSLDTIELAKVLDQATKTLGKPLEILGMDACLMSNFEVAFEMQPFARFLVASEENLPEFGWDHAATLARLVQQPDITADALAAHIVEATMDWYAKNEPKLKATQTAMDLSKAEAAAKTLGDLASQLTARMPGAKQTIWDAQDGVAAFFDQSLLDVGAFAANLEKQAKDEDLHDAAKAVREAFKLGEGGFIAANIKRGKDLATTRGVSIYLPSPGVHELSKFYKDLSFAKSNPWNQMLVEFYKK